MTVSAEESPVLARPSPFHIHFCSDALAANQDEETFEFEHNGETHRLRVHDYAGLYRVPGLYEALVYDKLQCNSPARVTELLAGILADWPEEPSDLRVLDLGAGNGIMAEALQEIGVNQIVGLDLLPEAAGAAQRDRPDVYENYVVADLTTLSSHERQRLKDERFSCLVTVAALGFGDIPPEAFVSAFNLISNGGWLAMTIKEDFLDANADDSGFARLLRSLIEDGIIEIQAHQRYCHRLAFDGSQLFYLAVVARKTADIPRRRNHKRGKSNGSMATARRADTASLLLNRS